MESFTLELLHIADQEAGLDAIQDAPNLSAVLNALRADEDFNNTLTLSSGDAFIPGLFFAASEDAFGDPDDDLDSDGIADIQIQNELGIQAIALGNHEFDFGDDVLAGLISGSAGGTFDLEGTDLNGVDFTGADFPYLSANLSFGDEESDLGPLEVDGGAAPQAGTVTSSVVIDVNGESIGVVGATTPTLGVISSPDAVSASPSPFDVAPTDEQIEELAAIIQAEVDALLAADPSLNKVILLSHMQELDIEAALIPNLSGVDIVVGGGSNTLLSDENDVLRAGDSSQGAYPTFIDDSDDNPVALVNTDGGYSYVGRLVIDFDENGVIDPDSYDADVSGAFATDEAGVAALDAADLVDPEIQAIVDEIEAAIFANESNVFGISDVFLNGERSGSGAADDPDGVRTQETNLGNLTADANLDYAQDSDDTVVISLKNGGGIRANIGQFFVPPSGTEEVRLPNEEIVDGDGLAAEVIKPEGGISQNDIVNALSFNNGLVLLTLTKQEIVDLLEHGISGLPGVSGRFPQISGVQFSFDPDQDAGERIVNAVIVDDETGQVISELVRDGEIAGDANEEFRLVTLDFLASPNFDDDGNFLSGGDGYPFPNLNTEAEDDDGVPLEQADPAVLARVNPVFLEADAQSGDATFADDGTEQDALAEYLLENFPPDGEVAFSEEDTGPAQDARIQNLSFRTDTVLVAPEGTETLSLTRVSTFAPEDGGAEINAFGRIAGFEGVVVTDSSNDALNVFDPETGDLIRSVDLTVFDGYAEEGVTSVAASENFVAVSFDTNSGNGAVVVFEEIDGEPNSALFEVGNLPDAVAFSADGTKLIVSNEGEFDDSEDSNPAGSISIIDLSGGTESATVTTLDFSAFSANALSADGVRLFPDGDGLQDPDVDLEPEFGAFSPDGMTAYVTLQEANSVAIVDLSGETPVISEIVALGAVDHDSVLIDPSDEDGLDGDAKINLDFFPVDGLRMPDALATFEAGGETFFITANEGDDRGNFDDPDFAVGGDAARVSEILNGDVVGVSFDESVDTTGLERLTVSIIDGDTDGDGDIDRITAYGGRSVSIFDADGDLVADTGSLFAEIAATLNTEEFQGNEGEFENRSENKGVEPEGVTVGVVGGRTYAFVGLERDSGIVVLDVSDPLAPEFVTYLNDSNEFGDVSPEGLTFVPADVAGGDAPLLIVSYEESGTTTVYSLDGEELDTTPITGGEGRGSNGPEEIDGGAGDDELLGRRGRDTMDGGAGDDEMGGGRGDDSMVGGLGDDEMRGGRGDDTIEGGLGDDEAKGGDGDDLILGEFGDDLLRGSRGEDTLLGGEGNDELRGGGDADSLEGGEGDDLLLGRRGSDTLVGGDGVDTLTGGRGSDLFVFSAETIEETDVITDFDASRDMIGLAGDLAFDDLEITEGDTGAVLSLIESDAFAVLEGVEVEDLVEDVFMSI